MSIDNLPVLPSYSLADMAWPDIQLFIEADGICLVPFGSQESHGAAIPVGCDTYHCVETVLRAAPIARVPYTPPVPFGYSPHHLRRVGEGSGTVTLRASTCQALYYDILRSLIHQGFSKFVVVNGHASNTKTFDPVLRKLHDEHGVLIAIYHPYGERYLGIMEDILESPPEETPGWHAAEQETSQMLAHDERLVHMERLDGFWEPARAPEWMPSALTKWDGGNVVTFKGYEYFHVVMEHSDFAPTAVIGNPHLASAEKGQHIYDRFAQHLIEFIEELRHIKIGEIRDREFRDRAL
jgi:creatinine amidohydrolase